MTDDNGNEIQLGDILDSVWGYSVTVRMGKDGVWEGKLICEPDDPCSGIPYALNNGVGYTKTLIEDGQ